jgi:hypothetical protein
VSEYDVKAAFLYNFAKFIDWPSQTFSGAGSAFTICLVGDPFKGALQRLVQGEVLDGRALVVRRITEDARVCQIAYVDSSDAVTSVKVLNSIVNAPVLTVGEKDNFIDEGGVIRFVNSAGKIHFQINPEAAERAGLKISSRLLRLADIVRPRRRAGVQP